MRLCITCLKRKNNQLQILVFSAHHMPAMMERIPGQWRVVQSAHLLDEWVLKRWPATLSAGRQRKRDSWQDFVASSGSTSWAHPHRLEGTDTASPCRSPLSNVALLAPGALLTNSFLASPSSFAFFFRLSFSTFSPYPFQPPAVHFSPLTTFFRPLPSPDCHCQRQQHHQRWWAGFGLSILFSLLLLSTVFIYSATFFPFLYSSPPLALSPRSILSWVSGASFLFFYIWNFVLYFLFLKLLSFSPKAPSSGTAQFFLLFFSASSLLPSSIFVTSLLANNGWLYDFAQLCLQRRQQRQQQWLPQWRRQWQWSKRKCRRSQFSGHSKRRKPVSRGDDYVHFRCPQVN